MVLVDAVSRLVTVLATGGVTVESAGDGPQAVAAEPVVSGNTAAHTQPMERGTDRPSIDVSRIELARETRMPGHP